MDKFYEGETDLGGESKEDIIEAVLSQRVFDKEEDLVYTYVRFLPKQTYILTLFGRQPVEEKISTGSLRNDTKLSWRKILLLSGAGCRRFWS